MEQKQQYSKENYRIMAYVIAPKTPRKENVISLNVKFPSLNLRQKAESVEVLDKSPTTNIFTIYFF